LNTITKSRVFVLLAPGFEETVVSIATRTLRRQGISVALVGLAAGPVRGAYGLSFVPDKALSEVERRYPQAVVLPGGLQATRHLCADPRSPAMVRQVLDHGGYILVMDTAYIVLQKMGLLATIESPPEARIGLETGGSSSSGWQGQSLCRVGVVAPSAAVQLLLGGQVVFGRNSGSALEAVFTLTSLLESGPPAQRSER
jgi:putative intracellular protease/amidase